MRLIDADRLLEPKRIEKYYHLKNGDVAIPLIDIKHAPTVEERKKGKWMPHREICCEYIGTVLANVTYDYWFCDACGYRVEKGQPMYNFCPNCGADMRGEGNGNE